MAVIILFRKGSSPEKKMISLLFHAGSGEIKNSAFVSQAMVMRASILILLRTSMLCHRKRSVTCSAVWKTESYICLVKMIYRSMWRQRNVNYQNQHDRKSE